MKKTLVPFLIVLLTAWGAATLQARWVKGNTHAHSSNSDGNEVPRRVMRWYQDHGYQFLVISDHDMITETAFLDSDKNDDFILIPGEEITLSFQEHPTHVNALNPSRSISAKPGQSLVETLQNGVDAARLAGAIPQINHPNWQWSFNEKEMQNLHDVHLFELLNVNRDSNNFSAGGKAGTEELWDALLSKGLLFYGVASDDTHDYLGDFLPYKSYPGKGWVMVRVAELTPATVCAALDRGDFYASTGVELADVQISKKEYRLTIKPVYDAAYSVQFIGKGGAILSQVDGPDATYVFKGDELYVRAKVVSSTGEFAFCQPVFVKK